MPWCSSVRPARTATTSDYSRPLHDHHPFSPWPTLPSLSAATTALLIGPSHFRSLRVLSLSGQLSHPCQAAGRGPRACQAPLEVHQASTPSVHPSKSQAPPSTLATAWPFPQASIHNLQVPIHPARRCARFLPLNHTIHQSLILPTPARPNITSSFPSTTHPNPLTTQQHHRQLRYPLATDKHHTHTYNLTSTTRALGVTPCLHPHFFHKHTHISYHVGSESTNLD